MIIRGPSFLCCATALRALPPQDLAVVTDFDHTVTTSESPGCHGVILEHAVLTDERLEATRAELRRWNSLTEEERIAECHNDPEERKSATRRNLSMFHDLVGEGRILEQLDRCVDEASVELRPHTAEAINRFVDLGVHVTVLSAGYEEVIRAILVNAGVKVARISIVANSLADKTFRVTMRTKPSIVADPGATGVIVLGDRRLDAKVCDHWATKERLKIALRAEEDDEKLLEAFDAVTDDWSVLVDLLGG